MTIVLVRVDDRFIHGQILEGWLPCTRAQEVFVANDELAADEIQKMIMQAAIPCSIRLTIDTVDSVAAQLRGDGETSVRQMILVDDPGDALRLMRAGVQFNRLNLGNLRTAEVRLCLSRTVIVGDRSLEALGRLVEEGVRVDIQSVPFERPIDLAEITEFVSELRDLRSLKPSGVAEEMS